MKITVGVLFGGRSGEHEVSLKSASSIIRELDKEKYEIIPIAVAKDGKWFAPINIEDISTFKPDDYKGQEVAILPHPNNNKLIKLSNYEPLSTLDIIFPIIHGTFGEDGTLQGLLEMANIPYIGAGVLGSAVGMDKVAMKTILAQYDLPQVKFSSVLRFDIEKDLNNTCKRILEQLQLPLFIKPANLGSSVGVTKVKNAEQLAKALTEASKYDRKVIIEEGLEVREIEISVLGNDTPQVSLPGEIIPCNEFYDYKAKYIDNRSRLEIPANLDENTIKRIRELAVDTFLALDCSGLARIDFFICKNTNKIYINEINTLPGFTAISMYPKLWEYSGLSMPKLLDKLIHLGFEKFKDKSKNETDYSL